MLKLYGKAWIMEEFVSWNCMRNSPSLNVGQSCLNVEKKRRSDQHLNMLKKGEEMRNSETFYQWYATNELFESQKIKVRIFLELLNI